MYRDDAPFSYIMDNEELEGLVGRIDREREERRNQLMSVRKELLFV